MTETAAPCPYGFHRTVCTRCGRCQCFDHNDHGGYRFYVTAHKYKPSVAEAEAKA